MIRSFHFMVARRLEDRVIYEWVVLAKGVD
jgi:hypothetical protein